jgi:hypothetical protein
MGDYGIALGSTKPTRSAYVNVTARHDAFMIEKAISDVANQPRRYLGDAKAEYFNVVDNTVLAKVINTPSDGLPLVPAANGLCDDPITNTNLQFSDIEASVLEKVVPVGVAYTETDYTDDGAMNGLGVQIAGVAQPNTLECKPMDRLMLRVVPTTMNQVRGDANSGAVQFALGPVDERSPAVLLGQLIQSDLNKDMGRNNVGGYAESELIRNLQNSPLRKFWASASKETREAFQLMHRLMTYEEAALDLIRFPTHDELMLTAQANPDQRYTETAKMRSDVLNAISQAYRETYAHISTRVDPVAAHNLAATAAYAKAFGGFGEEEAQKTGRSKLVKAFAARTLGAAFCAPYANLVNSDLQFGGRVPTINARLGAAGGGSFDSAQPHVHISVGYNEANKDFEDSAIGQLARLQPNLLTKIVASVYGAILTRERLVCGRSITASSQASGYKAHVMLGKFN